MPLLISDRLKYHKWMIGIAYLEGLDNYTIVEGGYDLCFWRDRRITIVNNAQHGEYHWIVKFLRRNGFNCFRMGSIKYAFLHELSHALGGNREMHGPGFRARLLSLMEKYAPKRARNSKDRS